MDLVAKIGCLVGIHTTSIIALGEGATSSAWHISDGARSAIVRIMRNGSDRPVTYQSEFTILGMVHCMAIVG